VTVSNRIFYHQLDGWIEIKKKETLLNAIRNTILNISMYSPATVVFHGC